jgi:hypothetical protein
MKRTALLGALLVAVIACSMVISTPKPAHALICCDNGYATGHYWVMKNSCSEAATAYRALAFPEASATCGSSTNVCQFTLPPCYYDSASNMYVIDGPASFGCKIDCGPILP